MSATHRLKQGFLRLPNTKKLILVGSALLMLSPFLPWYDNRNTFGIGDTFLGIQGPLFLSGILVALLGAASFFNMFFPLLGKNFFQMKRKSGLVAMLVAGQSLMIMLIANSVFFHPLFGTNVSHKATHFGLLIAYIAVGMTLISGFIAYRKEKNGGYPEPAVNTFEETRSEPVQTAPVAPQAFGESFQSPQVRPVATTPAFQRNVSGIKQEEVSAYHGAHIKYEEPRQTPTQQRPVNSQAPRPNVQAANTAAPNGDPLLLDAKTRYKLMKQKMRMEANGSAEANKNLWGASSSNTPYGR